MSVNIHVSKILLSLVVSIIWTSEIKAQIWTLQQCIDSAQVNNKNLQISRNTVLLGQQKHNEAIANLIPKINAVADYRYYTDLPYQLIPMTMFGGPEGEFKENQFGVPHNINMNLQFTMPLYNSQILGAMRTTKIGSELNELQYKRTEEQVFFDVSNIYYNAQILQQQILFIDSNLVNTKKLLQNMQLLKEQLMAKATDVSKIQLQLEQLMTQKDIANNKYEQVLNALKLSMGISISENIHTEPIIQYEKTNEYSISETIESQIVKTQNKLLMSELSTLKYSRLPSLSLYGTYGQTGFGYTEKPNDFLKFFPVGFVGVQFSYPLFNGTVTQKKINQKKIEIQNSELQLDLITEQNNMLTENAKRQKATAQRTVETTFLQIKLAQTVYDQTILQQKEGTATLTDVLLADNALREAQQTYLSVVIDYLKADLELKKLTGNLSIKN
jgi:OMF family outer membrane factor